MTRQTATEYSSTGEKERRQMPTDTAGVTHNFEKTGQSVFCHLLAYADAE